MVIIIIQSFIFPLLFIKLLELFYLLVIKEKKRHKPNVIKLRMTFQRRGKNKCTPSFFVEKNL